MSRKRYFSIDLLTVAPVISMVISTSGRYLYLIAVPLQYVLLYCYARALF